MADEPNPIAFAVEVMETHWSGDCCDIDGECLQDMAERHGIIVRREFSGPCELSYCTCAEVGDPPYFCYRMNPGLVPEETTDG